MLLDYVIIGVITLLVGVGIILSRGSLSKSKRIGSGGFVIGKGRLGGRSLAEAYGEKNAKRMNFALGLFIALWGLFLLVTGLININVFA